MNASNDFGFVPLKEEEQNDFGFIPSEEKKSFEGIRKLIKSGSDIAKDVTHQTRRGFTLGLMGTYGDVLQMLGLQPTEISQTEKMQYEREFDVLEKMKKPDYKPTYSDISSLTEQEEFPRISRLPTSHDISNIVEKTTGVGKPKTTAGRYAERISSLAGGVAAFGSRDLFAPIIAGSAGQTFEEIGAPPWAQAAVEMIAYLKGSKTKIPLTSKNPAVQNSMNELKRMGFSKEDITLAKNALEDKGILQKTAKMTGKAEKQFQSTLQNSEGKLHEILNQAFPGLEKGIEKAGKNASEFYQGVTDYAKNIPITNNKIFSQELDKAINEIKKIPTVAGRKDVLEYLEEGIEMSKTAKNADFYTEFYKGLGELGNWANPQTKEYVLGLVKKSIKDTFAANGKEGYQFSQMFEQANNVWKKYKDTEKITSFLKPAMTEDGINFSKMKNILSKPENFDLLKDTLGKNQASNLKTIAESGEAIVKMKDKIIGGPLKEYASLRKFGEVAFSIMTGNMAGISAAVGEEAAARFATKLLTDVNYQNLVKKMIEKAKESKFDQVRIMAFNLVNDEEKVNRQ